MSTLFGGSGPTADLAATTRKVAAALADCDEQYKRAAQMPRRTDVEQAVRAGRLALICTRRAAWWSVLSRATYRGWDGHQPFGQATVIAEYSERNSARFWRDLAADWRARAEHRPTSDAAGALSNWRELGVTA